MAKIGKHGVVSVHHGVGVIQTAGVLPTRTVLVNVATRTKNLSALSVQEGFSNSNHFPIGHPIRVNLKIFFRADMS